MKNALRSIKTNTANSGARVVDGKLILSFPDALTPVVWQMDFEEVKTSALEVNEGKGGNTFALTLKLPKGEVTDIASFETREQAVASLMAASHALENAHGKIRPDIGVANKQGGQTNTTQDSYDKPGGLGKWGGIALAIVLVVVLFGIWGSLSVQPPNSFETAKTSAAPSNAKSAAGVPVSADDFLRQ